MLWLEVALEPFCLSLFQSGSSFCIFCIGLVLALFELCNYLLSFPLLAIYVAQSAMIIQCPAVGHRPSTATREPGMGARFLGLRLLGRTLGLQTCKMT